MRKMMLGAACFALACSTPPNHVTVTECQTACDNATMGGCAMPDTCMCTQEAVERTNRCADVMGCGEEVEAFYQCASTGDICAGDCAAESQRPSTGA